jgi:probable F420-dependent oxidoreductase
MEIGVTIFATDRTMSPVDVAVEAEARGYASLYLPEHTHIPTSRSTPPPTGDAVLDEGYSRTLDPFIALAMAGQATSQIRLGTGVSLVLEHDPIALAKAIATLDHMTGGRVVLGVGVGWNREEAEDHGIAFRDRRARMREHMLCMQSLWRDEEASFKGEFVSLSPSWAWPKPVQQPRVPVLLGGAAGAKTFDSIAEWGDGWVPFGGAGLAASLPTLRAAMEDAGRDPAVLQIVVFGTIPTAEKLDYYRSIGVTEVVLRLPAGGRDEVLPVLDDYTAFLATQ